MIASHLISALESPFLVTRIKAEAKKGMVTLILGAKDAEHSNAAFRNE